MTLGRLPAETTDVVITQSTRVQINPRTDADIEGTQEQVPPASVQPALRRWLREGIVYQAGECAAGCYCDQSQITQVTAETVTIPMWMRREERKRKVSTPKDAREIRQIVEDVEQGRVVPVDENNQPYTYNPDQDVIGSTFANCCAQIIVEMEIMNVFRYDVELRAELELSTFAGECRRLPGDGEVV